MRNKNPLTAVLYLSLFIVFSVATPAFSQQVFNKNSIENLITLPLARQSNDYTCGAAVAISLLTYFGDSPLEIEAAKELGTNPDYGTDFRVMTHFFKTKGYQVLAQEDMSLKDVQDFISQGKPVVCLIQAWEDDVKDYTHYWGVGHYVTAVGYDDERIYFMDPWVMGNYAYIPKQEFNNRWHVITHDDIHLSHWGMVVNKEQQSNSSYDPNAVLYLQ